MFDEDAVDELHLDDVDFSRGKGRVFSDLQKKKERHSIKNMDSDELMSKIKGFIGEMKKDKPMKDRKGKVMI